MLLKESSFYNEDELKKYNSIFLSKINANKKYKEIIKFFPDVDDVCYMEITDKKNKVAVFKDIKIIYLESIKELIIREKIPIEFAIELISNIKFGIKKETFEDVILKIKSIDESDEKRLIMLFINELIKKIMLL